MSKTEMDRLFEHAPIAFYAMDAEGKIVSANPFWLKELGYASDEAIGMGFERLLRAEQRDAFLIVYEELKRKGEVHDVLLELIRSDGTFASVSLYGTAIYDEDEGFVLAHGILTSRSDEKVRHQQLGTLLKNVLDASENLTFVKDERFTYIACNSAFERFVGRSRDAIIGHSDYDLFEREAADGFRANDIAMLASSKSRSNYEWVRYPDGKDVHLLTIKSPLLDDDGRIVGLVGNAVDLTEQKHMQERLQESERRFQLFMENIPAMVLIKDDKNAVTYANKAAHEWYGVENLLGRRIQELMEEEMAEQMTAFDRDVLERGAETMTMHPVGIDGKTHVHRGFGFVIPQVDGARYCGMVVTDITDKYRATQELHRSEERLKEAQHIAQLGNWEYTLSTDELLWSDEVYRIFGLGSQARSMDLGSFIDIVHPEDREKLERVYQESVENGSPYVLQHKIIRQDNAEVRHVEERCRHESDASGKVVRSIGTVLDITERVRAMEELKAQEELLIAQSRHAAMGEMIAMIAHQWRQPITVISMDANNMLADIELEMVDTDEFRKLAQGISQQTQYLSKTIDDFRDFFRPNREKEEVVLGDIVDESLGIIGKSLEIGGIEVIKAFECDTHVMTFSRELLQVYINIIKNAKEVLVERKIAQPKIIIHTYEDETSVWTKICDNGAGISEEVLPRVFDPYFSTKDKMTGTGLGLYMSQIIVQKHLDGELKVANSDEGACFSIRLYTSQ